MDMRLPSLNFKKLKINIKIIIKNGNVTMLIVQRLAAPKIMSYFLLKAL